MHNKNVTLHHKIPAAAPLRENLPHILGLTSVNVLGISVSAVTREQLTDSLAYTLDNHSTDWFGSFDAHFAKPISRMVLAKMVKGLESCQAKMTSVEQETYAFLVTAFKHPLLKIANDPQPSELRWHFSSDNI